MRIRTVLASAACVVFAAGAQAQIIDVGIDFTGGPIAAADRAAFIAKVQAIFTAAGFGPGQAQMVTVGNSATPPAGGYDVTGGFGTQGFPGDSNKRNHTCQVDAAAVNALVGAGADADRRCRAYADVMSHEIAHTLCAVHQRLGNGACPTATGTVLACSGAATLMSCGPCIPGASTGTNMLAFNAASIAQIRAGIIRLNAGGANWDLTANFWKNNNVGVVEGVSQQAPISFNGETYFPWDDDIVARYSLNGLGLKEFEWGWMNGDNQFVEPLPPSLNPDQLLHMDGGQLVHFALHGLPGTPFEGQVFPMSDWAQVLMGNPVPAAQSFEPVLSVDYFRTIVVDFDVFGRSVQILVVAEGVDNGFYFAEPCVADLDGDGDNDGIDVGLFLQAYATMQPQGDINGDGAWNGIDVGLFLQAYGMGC